jgi:hypothetical protein
MHQVLNSALELFARAINLQSFDPKQEVIVKYTPPSGKNEIHQ